MIAHKIMRMISFHDALGKLLAKSKRYITFQEGIPLFLKFKIRKFFGTAFLIL